MPEIVSRIMRLPGDGIYHWEVDEAVNTLSLWIRQTAGEPYYICGGCGISVREIHSWTGPRIIRDLPWGNMDRVVASGGASRPLSPLWQADRAAALRGRQGPLHGAAGGGRGSDL